MEFGPKDVGRALGVIIVIAIFAYLYLDKRNRLKHKLNGRDRDAVLAEQVTLVKNQANAMGGIMRAYLDMFKNGLTCAPEEIHKALAPVYAEMDDVAEKGGYIEELFDADTLKLAGQCQSIFNDFGFKSNFYDIMGFFNEQAAPPFADEAVRPAYAAFTNDFEVDVPVQFTPETFTKLEKLNADFETARAKFFERLDKKFG